MSRSGPGACRGYLSISQFHSGLARSLAINSEEADSSQFSPHSARVGAEQGETERTLAQLFGSRRVVSADSRTSCSSLPNQSRAVGFAIGIRTSERLRLSKAYASGTENRSGGRGAKELFDCSDTSQVRPDGFPHARIVLPAADDSRPDITVSNAPNTGVDGDAEGATSGGSTPLHQFAGDGPILLNVDLKPQKKSSQPLRFPLCSRCLTYSTNVILEALAARVVANSRCGCNNL